MKKGNRYSYNFSYDNEAYYLKKQKNDNIPIILVLPVCRQTIELFNEHQGDMDKLAKRLFINEKSGKMYIKGFKPPEVDM